MDGNVSFSRFWFCQDFEKEGRIWILRSASASSSHLKNSWSANIDTYVNNVYWPRLTIYLLDI